MTRSPRSLARAATPPVACALARTLALALALAVTLAPTRPSAAAADPWADRVVSFVPGQPHSPPDAPQYDDPSVSIGPPARFTGEAFFPGVVSPFNPPYGEDEIVSIGSGGSLVVSFDEPVTDDPDNPFGIDLIVFANAFFSDDFFPGVAVTGIFAEPGTIEVSPDGTTWTLVPDVQFDGLFPTLGYLDAEPLATVPGMFDSDFTRPVDPSLELADFIGLDYPAIIAAYCGSGGGAGVDLASVGLSSISFVRLSNPLGAPSDVEVDALSDVRPRPPGDLTGGGSVGFQDLTVLLADWGRCPTLPTPCPSDLDKDGKVGFGDLTVLLNGWTQ